MRVFFSVDSGIDLGVDISNATDKAQRGDAPIPAVHVVPGEIGREALRGAQSERHHAVDQLWYIRKDDESSHEPVPDQDNDHQRVGCE